MEKVKKNEFSPLSWWEQYGSLFPHLKKLALRVLGQPCTSSSCERNFSLIERVQSKKRCSLAKDTLEDLVYCNANMVMMDKRAKRLREAPLSVEIPEDEEDEDMDLPDTGGYM